MPEGRKAKKGIMECLERWGLRTSQQEEEATQESKEGTPTKKWAWNDVNGRLLVEEKRDKMQTMITSWAEVKGTVHDETVHEVEGFVPEGRKEEEEEVQAEAGTVK